MLDPRTELADLCREHEVGIGLIDPSESLEQALDSILAECEQELAGTTTDTSSSRKLYRLIRLARQTRRLHESELRLEEERLDRLTEELQEVQSQAELLQNWLDQALASVDSAPGTPLSLQDRKQVEELLDQMSRMCHKINNPLTAVMGRAQMLQIKLDQPANAQTEKAVRVIEESARRVAVYVEELALTACRGKESLVRK